MKTRIFSLVLWRLLFSLLAVAGGQPAIAQDPNSTVTIHAPDSQATEAWSGTGTFTVRRTGGTNFSQLIFYELSGSASNGVDYEELSGTVEMPAGALAVSFTVTPIDDSLVEGSEEVVARITPSPLACPTCGYDIGEPNVAGIVIEDNDRGGTNHPPFVRLNLPRPNDTFVSPATITLHAYARDNEDRYFVRVEFFEGANSLGLGTFQPTTCPDPYCPYYSLTWSNVPAGQYTLTAKATDSAGVSTVSDPVPIRVFDGVNIYATDPLAAEQPATTTIAPDTATFTVRRADTNEAIVVYYEIGGTAANGFDYQKLSGEVAIPEGATSAEIVVVPTDDDFVEVTESVVLTLIPTCPQCLFTSPPCLPPQTTNCYAIGPHNQAVAHILDNDSNGTNHPPFVELIGPRNGDMFVAPADIRLVAFTQDAEDHYNLEVEFFEGTRSLGFGTFNGTRCWPGCPNYILTWSNVPPGQYTLTAKATDSGGASSVSEPIHITVIGSVNIYATDPNATEHPALSTIPPDTATFTVRRSGETDTAIVVYYAVSGTASNGLDYHELSGQVTIPAGATSAEIVVNPIDDDLVEDTETVVLTLIAPCPQCLFQEPPCLPPVPMDGSCYPIGPRDRAVAYIRDTDTIRSNAAPTVRMLSPQNGQAFTAPANIILRANAFDREDSVHLEVEFFEGSNSLGMGTFIPGLCPVCPFHALTWSNAPPGQYTLTAKATDSAGASSISDPVHIIVSEDRPPVVSIVARDPFASEGNFWRGSISDTWETWRVNRGGTNTATFVVRRHGATSADLAVNYEIGGTASSGADYMALSGSVTIPAGKRTAQIVIVPIDDALVEGIETVVLKLKPSPDYTAGFPAHAAAIIIDNDRPRPSCVRLRDGQFHLCGPGANGSCYRIEASTDLRHWTPICTNVVTDGALHFVDPDAPPLNARFYRIVPAAPLPLDD